ncbi:MAG: fumarylacetoacetate hydrolase family protein [Acidobacteriota bacterium]
MPRTRPVICLSAAALVLGAALTVAAPAAHAQGALSDRPETPFSLATFEAGGKVRVGMVLGPRVLDVQEASAHVARVAKLPAVGVPGEMRALIEQYATVAPRLYQVANHFRTASTEGLPFAFDFGRVAVKAPIKYPWNLLAAAANYRAHAEGMGAGPAGAPPAQGGAAGGGGFNAELAAKVVPERDAPIIFAKSPRSCIIDPNEPFFIVDGRGRTDYEGELAIVMGPRPAYRVPLDRAHDYVFGYSIAQDISDRGSERLREVSMFAGTNWFDGKSLDRAAPFGPVIVPKEFLPQAPGNLRITTRLNGEVVQDANTSQFIWREEHLIAYLTSRLTLYPGDVILTGTPAGTGAERQRFLRPGDVVTVEIEGIGTLTTPFRALSEAPPAAEPPPAQAQPPQVSVPDGDGLTALMRAAARGDAAAVRALLAQGADPNVAGDPQRVTALMCAAYFGHAEVVQLLVARGARLDVKDATGAAAVDWAAVAGHAALEPLLTGPTASLNPFLNTGLLPFWLMDKAAGKR